MPTLSTLPKIVDKKNKRLGRGLGSGSGAKSGRGTTRHQKARTNIPLHFEGGQNKITKKFPMLRGKGRNKAIHPKPIGVNVVKLNKLKPKTKVDIKALVDAKIVNNKAFEKGVKILSDGELTIALEISLPTSKKAQKKIEKAGGKLI